VESRKSYRKVQGRPEGGDCICYRSAVVSTDKPSSIQEEATEEAEEESLSSTQASRMRKRMTARCSSTINFLRAALEEAVEVRRRLVQKEAA
jgi:hypothetical protein